MAEIGPAKFIPADEVFRQKDAAILAERELAEAAPQSLAQYARSIFDANKRAKLDVEEDLISLRRRLAGEYPPDLLAALKSAGMPAIFWRLCSRKSRDVSGWLGEVYNQFQERTWDVIPSKVPELSEKHLHDIQVTVESTAMMLPDAQQLLAQAQQTGQAVPYEALKSVVEKYHDQIKSDIESKIANKEEIRCTDMEAKIDEMLQKGGYYEALRECINDISELKACCMKGPILRKEKGDVDFDDEGNAIVKDELIRKFYRVSPFDAFPSAGARNWQDGPFVEVEHYKPVDLQKMIGNKGYKDDVIKEILRKYGRNGYSETTQTSPQRYALEKQTSVGYSDAQSETIDSLDVWAPIPGQMLLDWGMSKSKVPDPDISYPCNIKVVGTDVWRAVINPDPLGEIPYDGTSFLKSNDSVWGVAPAELGAEIEDHCLNIIRHLNRNISESAGPMAEVNEDRLAEDETPDRWPGKTWVTTSRGMNEGQAVRYIQANLLGTELWKLYEKAKLELDAIIVPSFGQGSSLTQGGGRTASGLAMIASAESRNLKVVVANVDLDIQINKVKRVFRSIMMFDDMEGKAGLKLVARGITSQLIKENVIARQMEYIKGAQGQIGMAIHGLKGLAYMSKDIIKSFGWDVRQAIPNYDKIEGLVESLTPPNQQQIGQAGAESAQTPKPAATDTSGKPMGDYHQ